eukprot:Sdes_comp9309_c0_seq1m796
MHIVVNPPASIRPRIETSPCTQAIADHARVGSLFGGAAGIFTQSLYQWVPRDSSYAVLNSGLGRHVLSFFRFSLMGGFYLGIYGLVNHSLENARQKKDMNNTVVSSMISGSILGLPSRRLFSISSTASIPTLTFVACHFISGKRWSEEFDGFLLF